MLIPAILIGLVVFTVFYVISFYNQLKSLQVKLQAALQEIGNQLKRQAGLIPNLVESAKSYLEHEKGIYSMLTEARKSIDSAISSSDPKSLDSAQDSINKILSGLRVVVESNPALQSAGVVTSLMTDLKDTADKIMYSRRLLIDLTADYNTAIATFPGNILASILGLTKPATGLATPDMTQATTVSQEETKTPEVKLN